MSQSLSPKADIAGPSEVRICAGPCPEKPIVKSLITQLDGSSGLSVDANRICSLSLSLKAIYNLSLNTAADGVLSV